MKILLATPLYPPDIGGPSMYAFHIEQELLERGHTVNTVKFGSVRNFPTILRHFLYLVKVLLSVVSAERVICFDASSVGVPTIFLCKIFRKKCILRIGGDFLWESYVERTGEEIPLTDFYKKEKNFTFKEILIKKMLGYVFRNVSKIAVNTPWLGGILSEAYKIPSQKIVCIENNFNPVVPSEVPKKKIFLSSSRNIKIKNKKRISKIFDKMQFSLELLTETLPHKELQEKLREAYAIVVLSFSEVNPNLVLDGLSQGKPFLLTRYTGLPDRFKPFGILVDPFDANAIQSAILKICDNSFYETLRINISSFRYTHSWKEITDEFLNLLNE